MLTSSMNWLAFAPPGAPAEPEPPARDGLEADVEIRGDGPARISEVERARRIDPHQDIHKIRSGHQFGDRAHARGGDLDAPQ